MGTIRYYPMKIINHKLNSICTMTYPTKEEAMEYALSRGLKESEVHINELFYCDDSWDVHIKYDDESED